VLSFFIYYILGFEPTVRLLLRYPDSAHAWSAAQSSTAALRFARFFIHRMRSQPRLSPRPFFESTCILQVLSFCFINTWIRTCGSFTLAVSDSAHAWSAAQSSTAALRFARFFIHRMRSQPHLSPRPFFESTCILQVLFYIKKRTVKFTVR
jgi:hypothetical protein